MENYSLLMGDNSGDEDGGGVDGEAFRGHFPVPAACRNRDSCPPDLGFAMAAARKILEEKRKRRRRKKEREEERKKRKEKRKKKTKKRRRRRVPGGTWLPGHGRGSQWYRPWYRGSASKFQGGWGTRRYLGRYPGPEAPALPPDRALLATWPPPVGLARALVR
ncbi:hypothetical protein QYE76_001323 [Lolium multiflorum]|uniref:Uncharacterized protein n=1 Tax=Lolium multiflorum TaxID=4521 RepID=A0AAD8RL29_LOLMU|nr:hypothetical protein QYE76_001323 [Lolium multiflorum]